MKIKKGTKKDLTRFDISDILFRSTNSHEDFYPKKVALRISALYLFAGALWILLSDNLLIESIMSKQLIFVISMIKGWVYVILTAVILYFLIKMAFSKIQSTNKELVRYAEQLKYIAYKDSLTMLPNRLAFYEASKLYLSNKTDCKMALMIIDIDNFKYINDTLGHTSGDKLLVNIGKKLLGLSDGNKSIYRISGDEFLVFVNQYKSVEEIENYSKEILNLLNLPFKISDSILNITVSIGIALYPLHGHDVDTLLKCTDVAIYKAKSISRGGYTFYSQDIGAQIQERATLENELYRALELKEFSLYYQPQMDMETGEINSIEALLRWSNKKLGFVSPVKFISVAEETNLINPIGEWVLLNVCNFLKELNKQGYPEISISVNISIIQLLQNNFTEKVIKILSQTDIDPKFIELEITESVLIESYDAIREKLMQLKSIGIKIALDDFGKGYSSLSYLTHIPINTLKIDKNFIDTISNENDDTSLTDMIIMIGRRLGLSIVAEGVETKAQLMYLKKHNCNKIQGFYFSKPLPQEEILDLLDNNSIGLYRSAKGDI
jgi:diguanylate cyclase (GGDEF)-like protein